VAFPRRRRLLRQPLLQRAAERQRRLEAARPGAHAVRQGALRRPLLCVLAPLTRRPSSRAPADVRQRPLQPRSRPRRRPTSSPTASSRASVVRSACAASPTSSSPARKIATSTSYPSSKRRSSTCCARPSATWFTPRCVPLVSLSSVGRSLTRPSLVQVYLCLRVLFCRIDNQHLSGFWPVILAELVRPRPLLHRARASVRACR